MYVILDLKIHSRLESQLLHFSINQSVGYPAEHKLSANKNVNTIAILWFEVVSADFCQGLYTPSDVL